MKPKKGAILMYKMREADIDVTTGTGLPGRVGRDKQQQTRHATRQQARLMSESSAASVVPLDFTSLNYPSPLAPDIHFPLNYHF